MSETDTHRERRERERDRERERERETQYGSNEAASATQIFDVLVEDNLILSWFLRCIQLVHTCVLKTRCNLHDLHILLEAKGNEIRRHKTEQRDQFLYLRSLKGLLRLDRKEGTLVRYSTRKIFRWLTTMMFTTESTGMMRGRVITLSQSITLLGSSADDGVITGTPSAAALGTTTGSGCLGTSGA